MDKPLHISRLIEQDFMRIRALDIQPGHKTLILLRGENEQGKTSAIRGLISTLAGKKFDPDEPIRRGEDNAIVDITLADDVADRLRATVSWTPKGRYLTLRSLDGAAGGDTKLTAGQSILDNLTGALMFDPLAFMRQKPDEQLAMLMRTIGKADAYAELQARRQKFFEQRTIIGRALKEAQQRAKDQPDPAPGENLVERPLASIETELTAARLKQSDADQYKEKLISYAAETNRQIETRERMWEEVTKLEARLGELKQAIGDAARVIEERQAKAKQAQDRWRALQAAVPGTDAITRQLAELQVHNNRVQAQQKARAAQTEPQRLTRERDQLTSAIEAVDAEVRTLLTHSDIGQRIEGLAVNTAGEITHHNLPISQASGMRQLELSCLIGMAAHHQLHDMCIDEGDKLDAASLQRLKELARDYGYHVWMTAIYAGDGADDEHLVEIHDGQQSNAPPPPTPTPQPVMSQMYEGTSVNLDTLDL